MNASPTELTLAHLRRDGWLVAVVEKWNPHARIRQDLFGFIDLIAIRGAETMAVQACAWGDIAKRARKIADSPHVAAVREAGWTIMVAGWKQKAPRARYESKWLDVS